jgi:hypothetical protein
LSPDQVRGANVLAACLVPALGFLAATIVLGSGFLFFCTLIFALLALPASAIYFCDAGWPRQAMAAITLVLLAAVLLVVAVGLFERQLPQPLVALAVQLINVLPLAMLASQFAANYLAQVTPRK